MKHLELFHNKSAKNASVAFKGNEELTIAVRQARTADATQMISDKPTDPACIRIPFGETKMPDPITDPIM